MTQTRNPPLQIFTRPSIYYTVNWQEKQNHVFYSLSLNIKTGVNHFLLSFLFCLGIIFYFKIYIPVFVELLFCQSRAKSPLVIMEYLFRYEFLLYTEIKHLALAPLELEPSLSIIHRWKRFGCIG